MKRKYKWGTNEYYRLSGKYKNTPTYIQTMLSDQRYKKRDYMNAIKYLKINLRKVLTHILFYYQLLIYMSLKIKKPKKNQNYIIKNK